MVTFTGKSKRLLVIFTTALAAINANADSNVAQQASALTASVNPVSLSLLTDNGRTSYWSSDGGEQTWGQYQYVEFDWTATCRINLASIYWAPAKNNVLLPSDAYYSYFDGTNWIKGANVGALTSSNISNDSLNIQTNKLRIYMKSDKACGLREVRLLGTPNVIPGEPFAWPAYTSTLNYNYRNDFPNGVPAPTKMLPESNGQVGKKISGWWAFCWGKNKSKYVTDTAIDNLLARLNSDFGYFRDSLGWLPDKRARRGYYSTVYLYGSGCYSDNASNTEKGGWQGATWYNGESWPMINLSYYPVACFDPAFTYDSNYSAAVNDQEAQQSACIHEGIHAVFADLEGCKNAAWFQESGNTSMQADAELSKTPDVTPTSMGYLSAANMIAPFIPIECYSGWLLDGSFGGPSAEGVNMYNNSGQVCTWRSLLGGYQYGELFAHFLSVRFGNGALPWIWRYAKDRVLTGIADSLGEAQTRRLILEYRAKQAMVDFGKWSKASRALLNDYWLRSLEQEWSPYWIKVDPWKATPYANMYKCNEVDSAGWYYPEYRTTPGWSGANFIPLHVSGNQGDTIRIHFKPLGSNMVCQLCYRTKRGQVHYSQPCYDEGNVVMALDDAPANKVVIAVVCNTDYIYKGESTRTTHHDYRLKMMDNVYAPGNAQLKWYNYTSTLTDRTFKESDYAAINEIETDACESTVFSFKPQTTKVMAGDELPIHFTGVTQWMCQIRLYDTSGSNLYNQSFLHDGNLHVPASLQPGVYILTARNGKEQASEKIIIEK